MKPQVIAMDGPVAVGKSSVGSSLAKKLGYFFFDTGMMYRAFTWKALESGVFAGDEEKLCQLAGTIKFDFICSEGGDLHFLINGKDISTKLLCSKVEEQVSLISKVAKVRQAMVAEQRRVAQRGKVVMAGRDIGTVVLPEAKLKIFLTASAEERANRRYKELLERRGKVDYQAVLAELVRRDEIDVTRSVSPLRPASDAIIVDTEKLSLQEVVDRIYALAVNR